MRISSIVLFLLVAAVGCYCQNLENIGNEKPFGLSGGISASNVFYHAAGIDDRRNPNNYFLSGNLNLSIFDWSVPVSFSYSDQNRSFQQPFNQYGLSPTYKWITLDAGYRSKSFSNYTVGGHLYLGGGFDLAPTESLRISAFYGRLNKAVREDTTVRNNSPAYERMGGGLKFTVGGEKNSVSLILFKALDDIRSLSAAPVKAMITPQENFVSAVEYNITLAEKLTASGEVASSAMTNDVRADQISAGSLFDRLSVFYKPRVSSSYYFAYKSSIQYTMNTMAFGFAHERIDPGYRTLGSYYFNNNIESFAFTAAATGFNKKARLNIQTGLQRNNLDKKELNTMNRLSGALAISFQASPRLVYNLSYSNFQTVINFRSQFDQINQSSPYETLDTLNYRQLSQNGSLSGNYIVSENKDRQQNLSINMSYQQTSDAQANKDQPSGTTFYNFNASWSLALAPHDLTINLAANGNISRAYNSDHKILGPTLGVRKTFLQKNLSASATCSYNQTRRDDSLQGTVTNLRATFNWTVKEKHQLDFSAGMISRTSVQSGIGKSFGEFTLQISYAYNFSTSF